MKYMIDVYQAKPGTKYIFMPYTNAEKLFDFGHDYEKAYTGVEVNADSLEEALSRTFAALNRYDRPHRDTARSASMSDVFIINDGAEATAFYCDTLDWADVSDRVFNNLFAGPENNKAGEG